MDLGALLLKSGAILKGHFVLTSGRHSDTYFEKFRVLEQPDVLSTLCQEIANEHTGKGIEAVAGPTTGGIIIAFEVARLMGLPAIYVENDSGVKTLRRGKILTPGQKVLVVDDVLTTGRSLVETQVAIEKAGASVTHFAVLIDRSPDGLDLGRPLFGAYKVDAISYSSEELPTWLAEIPTTKPGTRVTI